MIQLISASMRHGHAKPIEGMFRDRKRVFIDQLKCKASKVDDRYERDRFDAGDAIYLVEFDPHTHEHRASVRLLRTTSPNLLSELYPFLCETALPRAADVWELTRFCANPDCTMEDARQSMKQLWAALSRFAAANRVPRYSCVTHIAHLSAILSSGWTTEPLGRPHMVDGGLIGAFVIHIHPAKRHQAQNPRPLQVQMDGVAC